MIFTPLSVIIYSLREKIIDEMDFWSDLKNTFQCKHCKYKNKRSVQRKCTAWYSNNFTNLVTRKNKCEVAKQAWGELGLYCLLNLSLGQILNNKQKEAKNVVTGQLFKE